MHTPLVSPWASNLIGFTESTKDFTLKTGQPFFKWSWKPRVSPLFWRQRGSLTHPLLGQDPHRGSLTPSTFGSLPHRGSLAHRLWVTSASRVTLPSTFGSLPHRRSLTHRLLGQDPHRGSLTSSTFGSLPHRGSLTPSTVGSLPHRGSLCHRLFGHFRLEGHLRIDTWITYASMAITSHLIHPCATDLMMHFSVI